MDIFSKMAGETLEHVTQETVTETAITAERPTYSYSRRSTPTLSERFSGTVFRYLGFQEVIFFSVNNSSPIYPFRGKVNFLPKPREKSAPRLKIEWGPFMKEPLHPSIFEKKYSVAHISSNGYFSSGKPGNYFLAGNKKIQARTSSPDESDCRNHQSSLRFRRANAGSTSRGHKHHGTHRWHLLR